ncbi:hypothetical protein LIER_36448 [Lithospermum erythrorhizon]|uniref:Uncharacterized protein n=1 Tax=Lithospermum erythrorhizon TaxID=34254 RepID=A0AAV3P656_LITER
MHQNEMYAEEIEKLKETAKRMLMFQNGDVLDNMIMIDTIERLGLSYHFEKEIEDQLEQIYLMELFTNGAYNNNDGDLFFVSLHFRLLRQHGYKISSGVFERFKKSDDQFSEILKSDTSGLLALYEASYWRTHGEEILEEAFQFTTPLLELFVAQNSSNDSFLATQVAHSLKQPLHRGVPRVEMWHFIFIYEESDMKNDTFLRFAKLDFNMLQILHKKELHQLSRWWKALDIISKLEYPRDRLVESYFWALAMFHEPHFSISRIVMTKVVIMISIIDDTCDAHATLEEVDIFTRAVQRWNYSETDRLPDYMKLVYKMLLDLFEDFIEQFKTREDIKSLIVNHIKEGMKQLVTGYWTEMKWFMKEHFPKFEEYMRNGLITSVYYVVLPTLCLGTFLLDTNMIAPIANEVSSWLSENSKFSKASAIIGRLNDDLASFEREKEMGQIVTGVECYMKEYDVSKEEAFHKFNEITENAWKDINEGCFKPTKVPSSIIAQVLNLCRVTDFVYKNEQDAYTYPAKVLEPLIVSLLVEPILTS